MKLVNLDKFATKLKIQINGQEYEISGMTVEQVINQPDLDNFNTEQERIENYAKYISNSSNIPYEEILKLEANQIGALMDLTRGVSPEIVEENYSGDRAPVNDNKKK